MKRVKKMLDPARRGQDAEELRTRLRAKIVGQDEAIAAIVDAYQTFAAGLAGERRPAGSFLFLGPTGTGKTSLVEATAEALVGDPRAVIKVDCAEFQHSHEIAKLTGSPPGYLGHRETHPALTQEALNRSHTDKVKLSFVLFDEVEKASDSLWNLLLGILDKATLTLGDNRQVDFSRAMIFLTGNLGAREMMATMTPGMGFATRTGGAADLDGKVERVAVEAARRRFAPEFLNRIDKVVVFHPLGEAQLRRILDLELAAVARRFQEIATPASFEVSEAAKTFLLEDGADPRYGARHLKRSIERSLVHPVSNLIASGQVGAGDRVSVECDRTARRLVFYEAVEVAAAA